MAIKKIGSATEVLTLDEARKHLRIEAFGSPLSHPDDAYITALITVARDWCEQYLQRAIGTQVYELAFTEFKKEFALLSPLQQVNSLKYLDEADAEQTLADSNYAIDDYSEPALLVMTEDAPSISTLPNPVKINFTAGYSDNTSPDSTPCPFAIRAAMLLIIGNLYENRQQDQLGNTRISFNSLPMGVTSLLQPYRLGMGL
jgi:uncharacterized phiE125 gp8 family phage protein